MQHFTKEFKETIINEYKNGTSYKGSMEMYKIPKTCLYDWLKLYNKKFTKMKKHLHTNNTKIWRKSLKKYLEKKTI